MAEPAFTPAAEPARQPPWVAVGAVVALIVVVVFAGWLLSRNANQSASAGPDPYAANIKLAGAQVSMAQNGAGASVIYVEGNATNSGDKTVTRARVRAEFKDTIGQVVLRTEAPLMMRAERPGYSDAVDLGQSPLRAGQSRPFKMVFEGVPNSWNLQPPDLAVMHVSTK
jgi:hypothetical protein